MQFVLFGGLGFVGAHMESYLKRRDPNCSVHIADIHVNQPDSTHHQVDVRRSIAINAQFSADTVIYNFAAIHKTPGHPSYDYFETNMLGAENVTAFARAHGIRTIVFTSSIAPYGAAEEQKSEESLPTPNTPYGISKLVAEKIHLAWQAEHPENKLVIVRPGIIFGKGEGGNYTRLAKALQRGLFAYAGRKDTLKAGIYVKDLVRVLDLMTQSPQSVQLYNACFLNSPTIEQIVQAMQKTLDKKSWVPVIPSGLLRLLARLLAVLDVIGLGFHPDRVRKLMISTAISGAKLHQHYPLQYSLETALADWFEDCGKQGLF